VAKILLPQTFVDNGDDQFHFDHRHVIFSPGVIGQTLHVSGGADERLAHSMPWIQKHLSTHLQIRQILNPVEADFFALQNRTGRHLRSILFDNLKLSKPRHKCRGLCLFGVVCRSKWKLSEISMEACKTEPSFDLYTVESCYLAIFAVPGGRIEGVAPPLGALTACKSPAMLSKTKKGVMLTV
jgi:hypothetical protein